jgi:hypothetical protein
VLDEIGDGEHDLEQHDRRGRRANQDDSGQANGKREQEFAGMEADPSRRRERRVRMVNLVEAP